MKVPSLLPLLKFLQGVLLLAGTKGPTWLAPVRVALVAAMLHECRQTYAKKLTKSVQQPEEPQLQSQPQPQPQFQ
jgi:hypothetical protein